MEIIAFNGSPRKSWNTATLLEKALEGAASQGATTKLIHLYDLKYQGCKSCFGCKTIGGPSQGRCAMKDDLTPILDTIKNVDAILLGSPVYFWNITGETKSCLERLLFPFYRYVVESDPAGSRFPRKIRTGFIYTFNAPEDRMLAMGFDKGVVATNKYFLGRVFGESEAMFAGDTYQFDDYSKIEQYRFDPAVKAAHRAEQWPADCQRAFEMGARLVAKA